MSGILTNIGRRLAAASGASVVGFIRDAVGAVAATVGGWANWQAPSVLDFMTEAERADVLAGTFALDVSDAVQLAINHCLENGLNLTVEGLCRLDKPVYIDRAVDTTADEFHIIGRNSRAGFYTANPISMFSTRLPGFTEGAAGSEQIVFDRLRFEAPDNTINCFALDGNAFLRIRVKHCYFRKIRLAYTNNFFQTWLVIGCQIRKMKGIFMEAGIAGPEYVGLDGYGFDLDFIGNIFEDGDQVQSAFLKLAGNYNGGVMSGNLFEGATGPFLEVGAGGTLEVSGNYFEAVAQSVMKLGSLFSITLHGNRFGTGAAPDYWPVDCQTAYTVIGQGNFSEGNLYKSSGMQTTNYLNGFGFYKTAAKGLISLGDVAYNGKVTDDENFATKIDRVQSSKLIAGLADYSVGDVRQNVATMQGDGVSGVKPPSQFNFYTTPGFRDKCSLDVFIADTPNGEYAAPVLTIKNDLVSTSGKFNADKGLTVKAGLINLPQYTSQTRPAYVKGALLFDTTLNKLVIGGAANWEVVTSN